MKKIDGDMFFEELFSTEGRISIEFIDECFQIGSGIMIEGFINSNHTRVGFPNFVNGINKFAGIFSEKADRIIFLSLAG